MLSNAKIRTMDHFRKQNGKCWICGLKMEPVREGCTNLTNAPLEATLDHMTPRNTTNGKQRPSKAAHRFCNMMRSHNESIKAEQMEMVKQMVQERINP